MKKDKIEKNNKKSNLMIFLSIIVILISIIALIFSFVNYLNKLIEVKEYEVVLENNAKLSATDIRNNKEYLYSMNWVPDCITNKERIVIKNIIQNIPLLLIFGQKWG